MFKQPPPEDIMATYEISLTYEECLTITNEMMLGWRRYAIWLAPIPIVAVFILAVTGIPYINTLINFGLILILSPYIYYMRFVVPYQWLKEKESYEQVIYTLTKTGILQATQREIAFFHWENFILVKENKEFLGMMLNNGLWVVFPKRYVTNMAEQEFIKQKITEAVAQNPGENRRKKTELMWVVLLFIAFVLYIWLDLLR